ncbi:MAG: NAD(P)H-hydrate epimerase [Bacteroidetes bacterium]|nr:NAD(P)H-hydrate epimerase [Bacteroidota bacterium]
MINYQTISDIPFISKAEMIEVDRLMKEKFKISLTQMMENAGRNLSTLARDLFFNGNVYKKRILILAGHGANGGGALVSARHLINWGANVQVIISKNEEYFSEVPKIQLEILKQIGTDIYHFEDYKKNTKTDLIIEGLVGYSLNGNPKGTLKDIIEFANDLPVKKLSLDVPAGIDLSICKAMKPVFLADVVLTLALPKEGMQKEEIKKNIKQLYLTDISVPLSLYKLLPSKLSIKNIFSESEIIRVW